LEVWVCGVAHEIYDRVAEVVAAVAVVVVDSSDQPETKSGSKRVDQAKSLQDFTDPGERKVDNGFDTRCHVPRRRFGGVRRRTRAAVSSAAPS